MDRYRPTVRSVRRGVVEIAGTGRSERGGTLTAHAEHTVSTADAAAGDDVLVDDTFRGWLAPGRVLGSPAGPTTTRRGRDVEAVLGTDGDALRIAPLERPGWGRCAVSYGPVAIEPGLAVAVDVLNGHQASQSYSLRRFVPRAAEWLRGSGTRSGPGRVLRCLTERRRVSALARLRGWARRTGQSDSPLVRRLPVLRRLRTPPGDEAAIVDNLVVGFLGSEAASSAEDVVAGLGIRSTSNLNGVLGPIVDGTVVGVRDRLTAVPLRLHTIVRDDSTLFAASWPAAVGDTIGHGPPQPLMVGPPPSAPVAHPAVQQNVSGEIGFSIDTRVFAVRVARSADLASWHAAAHVADELTGDGRPVTDRRSLVGPAWIATGPVPARDADGMAAPAAGSTVLADPAAPTGLVRVVTAPGRRLTAALLWRAADPDHHLRLELVAGRWYLRRRDGARDDLLADGPMPDTPAAVQVLDTGTLVTVVTDATVLASVPLPPAPDGIHEGTAVGLASLDGGPLGVARIEALPSSLALPPVLDLPAPPLLAGAGPAVFEDRFDSVADDLDGRSPDGVRIWRRTLGRGRLAITEPGRAEVVEAPGRTAYTVDWPEPRYAELTTTITPIHEPGSRCRGGLIAMQDEDDYLSVNLWFNDRADGAASVSSFFMIDGHEDVYDAVWVNVFDRIRWDTPVEVRLGFDGSLYQFWLDDELVLWRRISDVYPGTRPLQIRRVGLLANWEWGLDSGSCFGPFAARGVER